MAERKLFTFKRFAWFALGYNLLVILWGVFLRASHSGDGCGQYWLTCQGEAIPSAPELKTVIEYSHRLTTALAGVVVLILAGWAFRAHARGRNVRLFAMLSLLFIIVEGAIGGGLVLTGNTAANWTPTRPYWTAGHLINTFALVAVLTLTAWAAERAEARFRKPTKQELGVILLGIASILLVSISGSMAALSNMLFPSATLAEGIAKDFNPDSHWLLRLRLLHPLFAVFAAVLLVFIAGWIRRQFASSADANRWARNLSLIVIIQVAFGAATLLTLGPIVMQLGHLFLADLLWISFVLLCANLLTEQGSVNDALG